MADNFDKLFRSFFGLNRGNNDRSNDSLIPPDGGEAQDGIGLFVPGGFWSQGPVWEHGGTGVEEHDGMGDVFRHFHGDMERQMEAMIKQMDEMFSNIGRQQFPGVGVPGLGRPDPSLTPRDRMLKEPGGDSPSQVVPDIRPSPFEHTPAPRVPSFFNRGFGVPKWRRDLPELRGDRDLDSEIKDGDVSGLFERTDPSPSAPRHGGSRSSSSTFSTQTFWGSNGKTTQKKTVRGSDGQEETTVTRSIGDKSHSVTTRTDATGQTEKIESFTNMDEKDLPGFKKHLD